jgi:DNA-nicking Smr family endonuclease
MSNRSASQRRGKGAHQEQLNEHELWRAVTADVKPLSRRQIKINKDTSANQEQINNPKQTKPTQAARPSAYSYDQKLDHGLAPGLDKRTQLRLRRGKVQIEARIDLHGMTQIAAHEALLGFLERAYLAGKKTVLVVTGKGLRGDGQIGVLRRAVPGWLNQASVRQWVHAFDHAAPRDGGEGALYIVMRRRR